MSDWRARLRTSITLTSPDGTTFTANWQGNDITGTKSVAEFRTPLSDGTITQDLGAGGIAFPLTLYFEGDNHDTIAMAFARIFLRQRGVWTVIHPVYGSLSLQGITVTVNADPTTSANVTKVETTWIEPVAQDSAISSAELASQISAQVDTVNASLSSQFVDKIDITSVDQVTSVAANGVGDLATITASLSALASQSEDVVSSVQGAYNQAMSAITGAQMNLQTFAAQVQILVQLPATVTAGIDTKLTAFGLLATGIMSSITGGTDASGLAGAQTSELFLGAALAGVALAVATTMPDTREQAVQVITSVTALLASVTTALDAVQTASTANDLTLQYFSNSQSYADLVKMIGLCVAHLLSLIFDLSIAKRFTLDRPRNPLEITIREYGAEYDQEGNSNLDLFISSNALIARDIMLLPAGRQVVVYV